jgi:hypothetical protein
VQKIFLVLLATAVTGLALVAPKPVFAYSACVANCKPRLWRQCAQACRKQDKHWKHSMLEAATAYE